MDSYGIFHPDTRLQTPNSSFWTHTKHQILGLGSRVFECQETKFPYQLLPFITKGLDPLPHPFW